MALPNNFSPAEHLQDLIRRTVNPEVREWFNDVGTTADWDPDITTPRGSLRVGCTHQENDTADMTVLRLLLFYLVTGQAAELQAPIYGIPVDTYQQSVKFLPQVRLYFCEDPDDVERGYAPVEAELSFRIISETSQSMTESEARVMANKIKSLFCTGTGFRLHKGRTKCVYREPARGYQFSVNAFSLTEGKRLIEQVLDIQGHSPDWKCLIHSQLDQSPMSDLDMPSYIFMECLMEFT
jgi:hypothetical protein